VSTQSPGTMTGVSTWLLRRSATYIILSLGTHILLGPLLVLPEGL
jgi:hypothetical protein